MNVPGTGKQTLTANTLEDVEIDVKVVGAGGATAHLKFTEMFAVFA